MLPERGSEMSADIEIKGIDELLKKVERVTKQAPDKVFEGMERAAEATKGVAISVTPTGPGQKADNKRIKGRYKTVKTTYDGVTFESGVKNTAPHIHLANNGHNQVANGRDGKMKTVGYVPGLHFIEKAAEESEEAVSKSIERFYNQAFEELDK